MKNEAIEMIKKSLSVVRVAAFCLPLALVASCGSGSDAVQGTVINISPVSLGQPTFMDSPNPQVGSANSQIYHIQAQSPTGWAQVGIDVTIDVPTGWRAYEGEHTFAELPSLTPLPNTYVAKTGADGTYHVTVYYDWVGGVKGTATILSAFSGTGYGKTDITFTCTDDGDELTLPNCP